MGERKTRKGVGDAPAACCAVSRSAGSEATEDSGTRPGGEALSDPPGSGEGRVGLFTEGAGAARDRPETPWDAESIRLPGGIFRMGTDAPTFPADGEGPVRRVRVPPLRIDRYAVSNRRFATFVDATGYRTEAESFGWSFVFHAFVPPEIERAAAAPPAPWWRQVHGADWRHPEGPGSTVADRLDHPVVHVSWNDAAAFAAWEGKRLPTEAEWEYAARGGVEQALYPWGDELTPDGQHRCNVWQGDFPSRNTVEDGFVGTAPVHAFEPNGFGLFNVTGNAWEWCADWFGAAHDARARHDPKGPAAGPGRVIKGGSYLCHASYCNRYRVAARTYNTPDSSTGHMGFRLVQDG